jgi:fluoride exporter
LLIFDWREISAIFAGGVIGALLRALLSEAWVVEPGSWPWATFVVNVFGALLLGYFATRMQERLPVLPWGRPFVGTGLCGALTTFSAMQLEIFDMVDLGHYALAVAYASASITAGMIAVVLSTGLVRRARLSR